MIVGVDEDLEVPPELVMAIVVVAFDGGVLDGAVHPLDLAVGPRMVRLGEPVFDTVLATDLVEAVDAHACGPAIPVLRQVSKLDAIIREDGVQVVGDCFDQRFQERDGGRSVSLVVKLDEGELRGAIDPDVGMELASFGTNLGDVDMEVADATGEQRAEAVPPVTISRQISMPRSNSRSSTFRRDSGNARTSSPPGGSPRVMS